MSLAFCLFQNTSLHTVGDAFLRFACDPLDAKLGAKFATLSTGNRTLEYQLGI